MFWEFGKEGKKLKVEFFLKEGNIIVVIYFWSGVKYLIKDFLKCLLRVFGFVLEVGLMN